MSAPNQTVDLAAPVLSVSGVKLSGAAANLLQAPATARLLDPAVGALGCMLLPRLQFTGFTHLARASPESLRMDLTSVFLSADKLRKEKVLFGEYLV